MSFGWVGRRSGLAPLQKQLLHRVGTWRRLCNATTARSQMISSDRPKRIDGHSCFKSKPESIVADTYRQALREEDQ